MITGSVYVALPELEHGDQPHADRWALCVLDQCPDGASVVVDIGDRQYVTRDAAHWLKKNDHRLQIDIRGTKPEAVLRFVLAAREGDWSVVA